MAITNVPAPYKLPMTIDDKLDALMQKLIEIDIHVAELRSTLVSTFHDEFSPERKAASDRLGPDIAHPHARRIPGPGNDST